MNEQTPRIAFIGAGNMARAIIGGLVQSGYPTAMITASNRSPEKLTLLQQELDIRVTQDNSEAAADADVIVLAVKPFQLDEVCQAIIADVPSARHALFISIAAGVTCERLQSMLNGAERIIRCMPNTPSLLGLGMSGLYAAEKVNEADCQLAERIMASVGRVAWVDDEDGINTVIAAAGSAPAYFFLFLEAMQAKAEQLGVDSATARLLVNQAAVGAAQMAATQDIPLSELRAQVTSKGGTTAEAINHFQDSGLEQIVGDAMQAAVDRAREMAQQF